MDNDVTTGPERQAVGYAAPTRIEFPAADLGVLGLRLLGVKFAFDLLTQLPLAVTLLTNSATGFSWISFGAYALWHAAIAFVLLAFARPLAHVVVGRQNVAVADLGPTVWMTLVVAGAGVTLAIFSMGDLVTMISRYGLPVLGSPLWRSIDVLAALAKVAVGLTLFFKPAILVSPWAQSHGEDE